ncbi:MAG TPA: type IIL restriction-modification enzyme MmeI, partial [Minicystis sp.]|nr:type IIL restriction-modification enzyme MmeI [Minicystis sp.]
MTAELDPPASSVAGSRARGGFDAVVGNPPFLGGKRVSTVLGAPYRDWLATTGASSNADLVTHFLRGAFERLRPSGALGLVATNTIAQGDTRAAGLGFVLARGGAVFEATRRYRWPGSASVVVSLVHVQRPPVTARGATLDGRRVDRVSAFLFHLGGDADPHRLPENAGKAFIGCFLRGMGFTFDDDDPSATPLAEADRIATLRPESAEKIRPYLGGEELNASPDQAPTRKVIHFGQISLEEARRHPELVAIVEAKVRPERARLGDSPVDRAHKERWWRFANDRPELVQATRGLERMLVTARVSRTLAFAFVPTRVVPSDQLVVFAFDRAAALAVLQSRVHEIWARHFSSTFGDGLRYTPSDCFETFPCPRGWQRDAELEAAGARYDAARASLMRRDGVGLTALYNRFHDAAAQEEALDELRALHDALDRAVLRAFGFAEAAPEPAFFPDDARRPGATRLRWSDDARDEVLARLFA